MFHNDIYCTCAGQLEILEAIKKQDKSLNQEHFQRNKTSNVFTAVDQNDFIIMNGISPHFKECPPAKSESNLYITAFICEILNGLEDI